MDIDPLVSLEGEWRRDGTLDRDMKQHLATQVVLAREDADRAGFHSTLRQIQVHVLKLYREARTTSAGALTLARLLSETVRACKALGTRLPGASPFRQQGRQAPSRRPVSQGPARMDDDDETESDSAG